MGAPRSCALPPAPPAHPSPSHVNRNWRLRLERSIVSMSICVEGRGFFLEGGGVGVEAEEKKRGRFQRDRWSPKR